MNRTTKHRRTQKKCVLLAEYSTRALFGYFFLGGGSCIAFYVSLIGISHLGASEGLISTYMVGTDC